MSETPPCIFCRIVAGQIPATLVYEDDRVLAFRDVNPQAPTHLLVIPREHVASLARTEDEALAGHLLLTCARVARDQGVEPAGYRVVTNIGDDGGQSVHHLHLHILGGRSMGWPPG